MTRKERDALHIESMTINPKKSISLLKKIPVLLNLLDEAESTIAAKDAEIARLRDKLETIEGHYNRARYYNYFVTEDLKRQEARAGALENQNTYLGFTAKEWNEKGVRVKEGLEKVLTDCMIDRDRWKASKEALERAIKQCGFGYCSDFACKVCAHNDNPLGVRKCDKCDWQFDEDWFTVKEAHHE